VTPALVLVGPPGAGKSTIGRLVAERAALPFRDVDEDIESEVDMSISDIFVEEGEERFRMLERAAVRHALTQHDGILALGGGAVLAAETRELLAGHRVVFLDVGLTAAAERVGFNTSRPLLAVNPRAELARMLAERRPFYAEVATVTVVTDDKNPDEVAEAVAALLEPA